MMVHDAEESQLKGPTDVLAPYTSAAPPGIEHPYSPASDAY